MFGETLLSPPQEPVLQERSWSRERLRTALRQTQGVGWGSDEGVSRRLGGESLGAEGDTARPAAVLVPLVERPEGLNVLLTRRTAHLAHHAGQIAFPGGRAEASDPSPEATALREAFEETGLGGESVDILGRLDDYRTVTGFHVTPVVGAVTPPLDLRLDPHEVAIAFEVPLAFILDESNHRREVRETPRGGRRAYFAIPYHEHYIWGATAAMLINLCAVMRREGLGV
ncbi:CoA pyrophosphatase [Pararhodospirillum photometricum]|uniref:CoA pyrophosphatase n=1 Tax=Pararhodospirillum photometricum TaxID=1084 RepID=UPI001F5AF5BF|nr:CoA pyrophosphatase [Pararhodospirillum photometricum]